MNLILFFLLLKPDKLLWVYDNPDKVNAMVDRAYDWVKDLTWDKVGKRWVGLFNEAFEQLEKERLTNEFKGIRRNDPCPMCKKDGKETKWKRCVAHNPHGYAKQ